MLLFWKRCKGLVGELAQRKKVADGLHRLEDILTFHYSFLFVVVSDIFGLNIGYVCICCSIFVSENKEWKFILSKCRFQLRCLVHDTLLIFPSR